MALYWLTYKRNRRLASVAIISASSLLAARALAVVDGIGKSAIFAEGHQLAPEHAAHVPPDFVGRELSRKVAVELLDRIARGVGNVVMP